MTPTELLELYCIIGVAIGIFRAFEVYEKITTSKELMLITGKYDLLLNLIICLELGVGRGFSWPFTILKHVYVPVSSAIQAFWAVLKK